MQAIFAVRKKRNGSDFEQNQAIFAVRNKQNGSDFEKNQAIFGMRKKRNDSDFKQNQAIFAISKTEMVVILIKISKFSQYKRETAFTAFGLSCSFDVLSTFFPRSFHVLSCSFDVLSTFFPRSFLFFPALSTFFPRHTNLPYVCWSCLLF